MLWKLTFPRQMSSTSAGSRPDRSRTWVRRAYTRYSRLVSLNPPFFALVSGVRMARVITMSSAFLAWLYEFIRSEWHVFDFGRSKEEATPRWLASLHVAQGSARGKVADDGRDTLGSHGVFLFGGEEEVVCGVENREMIRKWRSG